MKLHQIKLMGGYTCPHFSAELNTQVKDGCCGRTMGEDYVPVCALTKSLCPGLIQCPRLDVKTKGELIKQWRADLESKKTINPLQK